MHMISFHKKTIAEQKVTKKKKETLTNIVDFALQVENKYYRVLLKDSQNVEANFQLAYINYQNKNYLEAIRFIENIKDYNFEYKNIILLYLLNLKLNNEFEKKELAKQFFLNADQQAFLDEEMINFNFPTYKEYVFVSDKKLEFHEFFLDAFYVKFTKFNTNKIHKQMNDDFKEILANLIVDLGLENVNNLSEIDTTEPINIKIGREEIAHRYTYEIEHVDNVFYQAIISKILLKKYFNKLDARAKELCYMNLVAYFSMKCQSDKCLIFINKALEINPQGETFDILQEAIKNNQD